MINRNNLAGESGYPFAFAVIAIALCAVLLVIGAPGVLAPAEATSQISTSQISATTTYAGSTGYFPDQFVNQAKEIEPMPEMYH